MKDLRRRKPNWISPSLLTILSLLLLVTIIVGSREGTAGMEQGTENAWRLFLNAAPLILLGVGLAGMIQVLIPPEAVGRWMGDEAGMLGLSVGIIAGALMPGGPYVMFPLAAALMHGGAGVGPMAGFLAARNLIQFNRMVVWDIPFLGFPFSLARVIATVMMPPVAIVLVPIIYRLLPGSDPKPAEGQDQEAPRRKGR